MGCGTSSALARVAPKDIKNYVYCEGMTEEQVEDEFWGLTGIAKVEVLDKYEKLYLAGRDTENNTKNRMSISNELTKIDKEGDVSMKYSFKNENDVEEFLKAFDKAFERMSKYEQFDEVEFFWMDVDIILCLYNIYITYPESDKENGQAAWDFLCEVSWKAQEHTKRLEKKNKATKGLKGCQSIKDIIPPKKPKLCNDKFLTIPLVEIYQKSEIQPETYLIPYYYVCSTHFSEFKELMSTIQANNKAVSFKASLKSYHRAIEKLVTIDDKDIAGKTEMIWDLLRCTYSVNSEDPNDVLKTYEEINSKHEILRVKNKMDTSLRNITINYVWKGMMCEAQIAWKVDPTALKVKHWFYDYERLEDSDRGLDFLIYKENFRAYLACVEKHKSLGSKFFSNDSVKGKNELLFIDSVIKNIRTSRERAAEAEKEKKLKAKK